MPISALYYSPGKGWNKVTSEYKETNYPTDLPETKTKVTYQYYAPKYGKPPTKKTTTVPDQDNINQNKLNKQKNEENQKFNEALAKKDSVYAKVLNTAAKTKGEDYLKQKYALKNLNNEMKAAGIDPENVLNQYNSFYKTEKIGNGWDGSKGAKPPSGDFDAAYYLQKNPNVQDKWNYALQQGNLDILEQYKNVENFALSDYTFVGKPSGKRGNKKEELLAAKEYTEKKPTDSDIAFIKDKMLGLQVKSLKKSTPSTELEVAISESIGEEITEKTKQFGALTQDALKKTIKEMEKAKAKEQILSTLGNLDGFQEILNINQTLSQSFFGESGIGNFNYLSFAGGKKTEEKFEKALQGITGINNSTIYNWQDWFDKTLKSQYNKDLELGLSADEADEKIKVDADFAKAFIEEYLVPRFDQSKSISEFKEYLDVSEEEQNPFQTQDLINAAADIGKLKSQTYLDDLKKIQNVYFDSDFYFNPIANLQSEKAKSLAGSKSQQALYEKQAKEVSKDWEKAKKQFANKQGYWYEQAYKYGVDPNDKKAFAKMHFQVKGLASNFDAAEDLWTPAKVQDYIYSTILPSVESKVLNTSIFGEFLKPDEFTDTLLSSYKVDPNDESTWGKILDKFGMNSFQGSYDELKDYVSDSLKTTSASDMAEKISDLKKEGITPSQKNLGVFYIEKPEDTSVDPEGETPLYKTFKNYGYQGDEKEFYETFFPDLDYTEQKILGKVGGEKGFELIDITAKDPLDMLDVIGTLSGEGEDLVTDLFSFETDEDEDESKTTKSKSYFDLGLDDEEDDSDSEDSMFADFSSLLKGF